MTIYTGVGSPGTVSTASGGKITPINNLGTSPIQVVAGNPARQTITFCNPGTIVIYVAPLITLTGATLTPSLAALGGCFPVFPGGLLIITGECQVGWQALAASASNNPLTVMESNL
jgi:hypothetical protein